MPDAFHYRDNVLYCEDVELSRLAAHAGTPCYVYSAAALRDNFLSYERALEGVPWLVRVRRGDADEDRRGLDLVVECRGGVEELYVQVLARASTSFRVENFSAF